MLLSRPAMPHTKTETTLSINIEKLKGFSEKFHYLLSEWFLKMSFFFSSFVFSPTDRLTPPFYPTCLSRCRTRLNVKKHLSFMYHSMTSRKQDNGARHFNFGLFHQYTAVSAWVRHTTHDAAGEVGHAGNRRREGVGAARLTLFPTIGEGTMRGGSDLPALIEQPLYI